MTADAELTDASRIARAEGLVASEVDGEIVILNIESGHFIQLNGIASRIWDCLDAPRSIGEICSAMRVQFDVEADRCRADVTEFVQQMRGKGLLLAGA